MLQGHNIICFSCDWYQDQLSKHHIITRLAKHNRILWINSMGLRKPTINKQDLIKAWSKLKASLKSLEQVRENLYVMSPLVIPFHGRKLVRLINRILLLIQIKRYQKKLGLTSPILFTFAPNVEDILDSFSEKLSLYYITDDFTQFSGHPAKAIAQMEAKLIDKCNVVIASAERLARKKEHPDKRIFVVKHGVNYQIFSKALNLPQAQWPSDIENIRHPIIGFYGEINDWLDLKMLAQVAKTKPEWSFVLIGRVALEVENISYLTNLSNVHYLGQKKFEELPAYCAAFDVALIPMKLNELTLSVNPLKLREYLAAGVPVVSAPLPEVLPYKDVVKFATDADGLIKAVEDILSHNRKQLAPILSQRVANETWDSKVEEISKIIQQHLV
jgi:glycosyltransferase involved in cell wall biosynthesis